MRHGQIGNLERAALKTLAVTLAVFGYIVLDTCLATADYCSALCGMATKFSIWERAAFVTLAVFGYIGLVCCFAAFCGRREERIVYPAPEGDERHEVELTVVVA